MKKLLAMLLALMMALSCTLALAEEEAASIAVTITGEVDVDSEAADNVLSMFNLDEDKLAIAKGMLALLDAASEKLVIADDGVQFDVSLSGKDLLTVAFEANDEGIILGSSAIPSYLITASADTVTNLMKDITSSDSGLDGLDVNSLTEAFSTHFTEYIQTCVGAMTFGEAEEGEYEYDGHIFTSLMPFTLDMKVIAEATNKLSEDINADDAIQTALQSAQNYGVSVSEDSVDETLDPEKMPAVEGEIYTNADGSETLVVVTVTPKEADEVGSVVNVLVVEGGVYVTFSPTDSDEVIAFTLETTDTGFASILDTTLNGTYVALTFNGKLGETMEFDSEFYFIDNEKPLASAYMTIAMEGERTMSLAGDGKTVVSVESLMSGEDSDTVSGLAMDFLLNGALGMLSTVSEAVPELESLINSAMGSMLG